MKKEELYLLQKYDNGDFFVYSWTPVLAAKGYKVMTAEQIEPFRSLSRIGKNNASYLEDKTLFDSVVETNQVATVIKVKPPIDGEEIEEIDDSETQDLVNDVVKEGPHRDISDDEVREVSVDQEDIQAAEMKYVNGLRGKAALESHMLEKYQCEVPEGRLEAMKAIANSMINDLAKENRLYMVENGVALR